MKKVIRVLVADDSALMRKLISDLLESDPQIKVIGTACNGQEVLRQIRKLQPDVLTMDIKMPRMSGLEALRRIMRQRPLPVIILSGIDNPETALAALQLGAFDFVLKPSGQISVDLHRIRDELLTKIKAAVSAVRSGSSHVPKTPPKEIASPPRRRMLPPETLDLRRLVIITASTGGPRALDVLIQDLPAPLPAAILTVQHMPTGFTASLARRLDDRSDLVVKEAEEGECLESSKVYIAPAGHHLLLLPDCFGNGAQCHLDNSDPVSGLRPAADLLMESAAELFGERCIGVVLTGMGSDGTRGLQAIKEQGGQTIAQDEASSVIYGMPRSAAESGFVDQVLPLHAIAPAIVRLIEQT